MAMPTISFLLPAHNEESVIETALDSLAKIARAGIEVVVGLDGCTDGTESVVKRYDFAKIVSLPGRTGKPGVLARLIEESSGDIIAVHDADWQFRCTDDGLRDLLRRFGNPELGAVVLPSHNIPFIQMKDEVKSFGFLGAGLGALLMHEYLIQKQTLPQGDRVVVSKEHVVHPFPVNIFRRGIIPDARTAADDFERFQHFLNTPFQIEVLNSSDLPYYLITDRKLRVRDHLRQRVKGHIARAQLAEATSFSPGFGRFYLPFVTYCLSNVCRLGLVGSAALASWFAVIGLSLIRAKWVLRKGVPSAQEAWTLRITRSEQDNATE